MGFLPSFLMALRYSPKPAFSPKHRHSPKGGGNRLPRRQQTERLAKEMFDGHGAIMAGKLQSSARESPSDGTRSAKSAGIFFP
jgi:hypothetical protein